MSTTSFTAGWTSFRGTTTLHATSDRHGVTTTTLDALSDQPRQRRAASGLSTKEQA